MAITSLNSCPVANEIFHIVTPRQNVITPITSIITLVNLNIVGSQINFSFAPVANLYYLLIFKNNIKMPYLFDGFTFGDDESYKLTPNKISIIAVSILGSAKIATMIANNIDVSA